MSEQHRRIRVVEREGVYDVICDVCHEQIMEGCSEVDIQKYLSCHNCHMVGECETLPFYKGPVIPYMEIETAEQFMEYCEKIEKFTLSVEEAGYFLEGRESTNFRFVVENDVLYECFRRGWDEGRYPSDLNSIKENMEEEIIYYECYLGRMEDTSEEAEFENFLMSGEDELMVEESSTEELAEVVRCYHEKYGPIWERLTI